LSTAATERKPLRDVRFTQLRLGAEHPDGGRRRGERKAMARQPASANASELGSPRGSGRPPADADRGRLARSPSEIPPRGWKDILVRAYKNFDRDRVITIAAGVTFYSILALFPAIAALVSLYGLFADPAAIASHLDSLAGVLPGGTVQVIGDELERLTAQRNGALGLATLIGLVTALWSANAGIKSLFDALNLVYSETEKRGFITLNAVSLAFTVATIGFVILALGAMVVLPPVLAYVGSGADQLVRILRWPALLIAVALWLAALYRFGPSRSQPKWRWITWGTGLATVLWLIVSLLFTWYAANFGSYNKTYGSLGAAVGSMVWIWLSVIVVLLGAEIDAEIEHQTARDTTAGAPKPMGARGATMADTVGPATD
jgi:membrane protein